MQTLIHPKRKTGFDLKELWHYKDLLYFLVSRDIKGKYKQSVLGVGWAVVQPFVTMIIFTVIFSGLAKIDPGNGIPYPVFSYVALVPWTYFSTSFTGSTKSLISGKALFTKVYFPRIIIPLTPVLSALLDFIISFALIFLIMGIYGYVPSWQVVYVPLLLILMALTALGIGLWLSALAIQYRDIKHMTGFLIKIMMYLSPVIYPISMVPEKWHNLYAVFPMVGVIEGFRSALIGINPMPWTLILIGYASAMIVFICGAFYFNHKEKIFADVA